MRLVSSYKTWGAPQPLEKRGNFRYMKTDNTRILKISAITGFILITLALILINNEPAMGYEISIYTALSPLVWIFLIGSIACGIGIIVQQAFAEESKQKSWWLIGLSIVMLSDFIILSLHALRGYFTYGRGDLLVHIGHILDIISNGHIMSYNVYPITHILITELSFVTTISYIAILNYMIPYFFLLHILGVYLLSKIVLSNNKPPLLLAVALSSVFFLTYTCLGSLPTYFSTCMMPFLLYFYFKTSNKKTFSSIMLIIIFMILFPFFHPLTSIILIFSFMAMEFSKVILNYAVKNGNGTTVTQLIRKISLTIPLMSFIIYIMWLSNHKGFWSIYLGEIIRWLLNELSTTTAIVTTSGLFERLNLQIFELVKLFIKMNFGSFLIYLFVALIAIIIIVRDVTRRKVRTSHLFVFSSFLALLCFFLLMQLFKTLLLGDYTRIIGIIVYCALPVFVGFALYRLSIKNQTKQKNVIMKCKFIFVLCIILIPSIIGIFNIYPSPYTLQANRQVTNMEINGMKWYYEHKDPTIMDKHIRMDFAFLIAILGGSHGRTDIYPHYRGTVDTLVKKSSFPIGLIPDHFNYLNYSMFGNSLIKDIYMPISKYDRIFYTEIYPQLKAFTPSDFEKLNHDPTVARLYSNGELKVYFVHATKSA